jgi:hypothetical protein
MQTSKVRYGQIAAGVGVLNTGVCGQDFWRAPEPTPVEVRDTERGWTYITLLSGKWKGCYGRVRPKDIEETPCQF